MGPPLVELFGWFIVLLCVVFATGAILTVIGLESHSRSILAGMGILITLMAIIAVVIETTRMLWSSQDERSKR